MKKLSKKLLLSILTVALTFIALGTSTFAWFSMNQEVKVDGMQFHTQVGNYLLIKDDTLASTAKIADANFLTAITDTKTALLEPVSTTTAKSFFYTLNGKADGDSRADDYVAYNAAEVPTSDELSAFNGAYGTTGAVGYIDYVFQLKAVNADTAAPHDIKITKLDLIYSGAKDEGKAYRVAVLVEDITSANPAGGSGTLKGIYAPTSANNQTPNYAVSAASTAPTALASNYNTVSVIGSVPATETKYFKVVIRLYLEGEDTTCRNDTYAALTSNWALNLSIAIDTASTENTPVSAIAKYTSATVSTVVWYYDGTYVWNDLANIGTTTNRTAKASADAAVKAAFGIE